MAEQLWLHSLAASEAARLLAARTKACEPGQAFTAGLLHDIGKVVMAAFAMEQVKRLQSYILARECSLLEAERELDLSHETAGRELARRWDLPPILAQVIGSHHSLTPGMDHLALVAMVNIADYLVRDLGIGDSGNPGPAELHPLALQSIKLNPSSLAECRREIKDHAPAIKDQWEEMMLSRSFA
jgi:putative nucleotidyltransferase with HDIG domain